MLGLHNDKVITVALPEFFKALRNMPAKTVKNIRIKSRIKPRIKSRIKSRIKPRRKPRGKSKKHHASSNLYSYRLGRGYDEAWRANMSAANEELPSLSQRLRAMEIHNEENDKECAICQDQMTDNEASQLNCGHKFHTECLENIIHHGHNRCPLCRSVMSNPLILRQQTIEEERERQRIIEELQALRHLERHIDILRERLNSAIPNMPLINAIQIQQIAAHYEEEAQRHYNEAYLQFTNYIRLHGIDATLIMYQDLRNIHDLTLELLTAARENTRNARQLLNNIRGIRSYNIT